MGKRLFNNAREWLDACVLHAHPMTAADDPARRHMGYGCVVCGAEFYIGLLDVEKSSGVLTRDEMESLRTATGRQRLPETWKPSGCVIVLEED